MRRAQELPPPNVEEILEDMEDLGVENNDAEGCCEKDKNCECCKSNGQRDFCGRDENASLSSIKVSTERMLAAEETLEHLLHTCMELVTEMGLPEDLKIHIQQLRCQ